VKTAIVCVIVAVLALTACGSSHRGVAAASAPPAVEMPASVVTPAVADAANRVCEAMNGELRTLAMTKADLTYGDAMAALSVIWARYAAKLRAAAPADPTVERLSQILARDIEDAKPLIRIASQPNLSNAQLASANRLIRVQNVHGDEFTMLADRAGIGLCSDPGLLTHPANARELGLEQAVLYADWLCAEVDGPVNPLDFALVAARVRDGLALAKADPAMPFVSVGTGTVRTAADAAAAIHASLAHCDGVPGANQILSS
jgi:hypothetical protein